MKGGPPTMESTLSGLSSLKEDDAPAYVQPHYRESYRLAIYALLCGGQEAYEEFLRAEQLSHLLSEEEVFFILQNAELPAVEEEAEAEGGRSAEQVPPSTYFPLESDEEVPDLDLGWPQVPLEDVDTSISLLFQPPRLNTPSIKEVLRKQIQEAKQVVAIAMDVFTDVDIFKEVISATLRGVVVYVLLDEAQFKSFRVMTHRVGVNIQDLKNLRVRTVQGQQYQCRSGVKFHGGLEQKFIVVDCRTVLYGTYSYSWSFEKINLSMVLVITGQLVGSFDEEFRRLYARSAVPSALSKEASSVHFLRDTLALYSPNSSQLSLHQIHMRSKVMHGMRGAQDAGVLTRGLSMQERLHQSHCADLGNLVRGHSYGGELQKLGSMTRLRMGTKDIGLPERAGPNPRAGVDALLSNRLSQQHMRHRTRYGPDQNMIPFNSETSLHRWKMDAYMNNSNGFLDASCEAISPMMSPMTSPYSSHTGLNEHQTQAIHSRSRDIKSRLDEMRHNRLSLQDYSQFNLKQSHESLRSIYTSLERSKYMSVKGQEVRPSMAELETHIQDAFAKEPPHLNAEPPKGSQKKEQILTNANRSTSYGDIIVGQERKAPLSYDWHEPLSRTTSAAELDMKLNEKSFKLSHLPPSGHAIQHPRPMESLSEIPEEKEGSSSRVNSSESTVLKDENEETAKDEKPLPKLNSMKSAELHHQDVDKRNHNSLGPSSAPPKEKTKPAASEPETPPRIFNRSTSLEARGSHTEKEQEDPPLQKTSMKPKVTPVLPEEKKASKKEEKLLQRKASLRSQSSSGSNQPLRASPAEPSLKRGQSQSFRLNNSASTAPETEKHKSPLLRLTPQRSSKRKTNAAAEQDRGPSAAPDDEGATIYHHRREKAYSRYEYLLSESSRTNPSEREKSSSLNRHDYPAFQSSSDNKLGRFMQRVGSLIHKNK